MLIKNPHDGYERFSRKGYFAFDLGSLSGESFTTAKFVLTLRPSEAVSLASFARTFESGRWELALLNLCLVLCQD